MKYSLIAFGLILLMLGCNSKNNQTEKPVITSNNLSTGFYLVQLASENISITNMPLLFMILFRLYIK